MIRRFVHRLRSGQQVGTVVLTLSLIAMGSAILVRHSAPQPRRAAPSMEPVPVHLYRMTDADWELAAGEGLLADAQPAATLVVFVDYECPFCTVVSEWLSPLVASSDDFLTVVYRQRPLSIHPAARFEAEVAACLDDAGRIADADVLYERSWDVIPSSVDGLVEECVRSGRGSDLVARDLSIATHLGFKKTPIFLLHGYRMSSSPEPEELRALLRDIREGRKPGTEATRTEEVGVFFR